VATSIVQRLPHGLAIAAGSPSIANVTPVLEPVRPGDEHVEPAAKRIGGDPFLVCPESCWPPAMTGASMRSRRWPGLFKCRTRPAAYGIIVATMALLTLKAINSELTKRGYNTRLEKAAGYFCFRGGEATDWIDRTVQVPTVNSLTLEQWM
jgi:hypothetical protein